MTFAGSYLNNSRGRLGYEYGSPIIRGLNEIQRQGVIRYNRPIWLQNGGHDRPNPKSSRRPLSLRSIFMSCIFHVFVAINDAPHVVSPLGPTLCEAVAKGAKLRHVRTDLDHVHHTASTWSASGSLWVQLQPNMNNWRQRALQLYPRQRGQVGPFTGSPGPS